MNRLIVLAVLAVFVTPVKGFYICKTEGLIALCPHPSDENAEWMAVNSTGKIYINGKTFKVNGFEVLTRNRTALLREFPELSSFKIVELSFRLPDRGCEIKLNNESFRYSYARRGEIFFKEGHWRVWFEDWSDFKPVNVTTNYTVIETPANLTFFADRAMVASYTYSYNSVRGNATFYLDAHPIGGIPAKELKLNAHFLKGTYRYFHYKFAVFESKKSNNKNFEVITTENWKWNNRGYVIILNNSRVRGLLLRILKHDSIYFSKPERKVSTRIVRPVKSNGKVARFYGRIEVCAMPDCNPVIKAIGSAKHRLYVEVPYVRLYPALREAIEKAAKHTRVLFVLREGERNPELEGMKNVSVRYIPNLHGKLVVSDGIAIITTANLDKCGMEMNREISVVFYGNADWFAKNFLEDYNFSLNRKPFLVASVLLSVLLVLILLVVSGKLLLPRRRS